MISSKLVLFIEPRQPASATPVIDYITRRMSAAFRQARECPAELGPVFKELDGQIEALYQEKLAAIAQQDFVRAEDLRDQADNLKKKKENIFREWRQAEAAQADCPDRPADQPRD
jgi:hypothetical protein